VVVLVVEPSSQGWLTEIDDEDDHKHDGQGVEPKPHESGSYPLHPIGLHSQAPSSRIFSTLGNSDFATWPRSSPTHSFVLQH